MRTLVPISLTESDKVFLEVYFSCKNKLSIDLKLISNLESTINCSK